MRSSSPISRLLKRRSVIAALILFTIFTFYTFTNYDPEKSSNTKPRYRNNLIPETEYNKKHPDDAILASGSKSAQAANSKLLKNIISMMYQLQPNPDIINSPENQIEFANAGFEQNIISMSMVDGMVTVPKPWFDEVSSKHSKAVDFVKMKTNSFKSDSEGTYTGFHSSNNGAVMIGGVENDLTWLSLISTRLFRKAGGNLPIEVMLPRRSDYLQDREICDKYLPQLNAKCIIIEDLLKLGANEVLGEAMEIGYDEDSVQSYIWEKFEHIKRDLSIILSSFENVLYLTPTNIMLKPIEHSIFEQELFKKNGLFFWPDQHVRRTLKTFYDIAGIKVGTRKTSEFGLPFTEELIKESPDLPGDELMMKTNMNDLENTLPYMQTDSNELLISKRFHMDTLLLSLYYNLNGPKVYHVLFTAHFEGVRAVKETIVSAAHVLQRPYYFMNTALEHSGYWYGDDFFSISLIQFDPIIDSYSYEAYMEKYSRKGAHKLTRKNYQRWLKSSSERRSVLFLNMARPSLRPVDLLQNNVAKKENGDRVRLISETQYLPENFERDVWRVMNDYLCHLSLECSYVDKSFAQTPKVFGDFKQKRSDFCDVDMKEHMVWISNNS